MASPSEGDVETAAAALIQAGEEICDQAEEEEVAGIDGRVGRKRAAAAAGVVSLPNFPAKRYTAGGSQRSASSSGQPKPG